MNERLIVANCSGFYGDRLSAAKDMVEGVPATVKEAISKDDAAAIKKQLEEAGAKVEVK